MQPNIYVSWSTSELRVRFAPLNWFKPSSKIFYWLFQGGTSFVDLLCFFCLVFAMPLWVSVYMCLVVTCWERADFLALICGVQLWVCHFPIGILGQVWYLIVSIPNLCTLTYFPYDKLAKVYANCFGHMTKMADMPIYGKKHLKIFSGTRRLMTLGLSM